MRSVALVLEDSKTQAGIIGKMIKAQGWQAVHCESVMSALEVLRSQRIDVLFLDIFVGTRNILTDFDRFRVLAGDSAIVLMTAGSKRESIDETLASARKVGADYVLRKPFPEDMVKGILATLTRFDNARPKHVLVIDDSVTVCQFIAQQLESIGYRVSMAQTMEYAFANIDVAHVDLVLCDIFMPGMGGLKGMRLIRSTWPRVKVVSMSGGLQERVSSTDALELSRQIGIEAQIMKPCSAEALTSVVGLILDLPAAADTPAEDPDAFLLD